ncbi:YceI family protein [Vibrio vulnificus]|uniref:YceI family protein n=1 Tax=Vibrio vulnificus TaxID=672 RepID=UPI0032EB6FD8
MKKNLSALSIALSMLSIQAFAATDYQVNADLSSVSFATVKNQFVIEPAVINTLTGSLDETGAFNLSVDLKGLKTGIPIRDTRLNELFFETVKFPSIDVKGKVDLARLAKGPQKLDIPVDVSMYGNTKTLTFPVIVLEQGDAVMVSSYSPVIVRASEFGIPSENLTKLAATVGGIKISDSVPLNLTLLFQK